MPATSHVSPEVMILLSWYKFVTWIETAIDTLCILAVSLLRYSDKVTSHAFCGTVFESFCILYCIYNKYNLYLKIPLWFQIFWPVMYAQKVKLACLGVTDTYWQMPSVGYVSRIERRWHGGSSVGCQHSADTLVTYKALVNTLARLWNVKRITFRAINRAATTPPSSTAGVAHISVHYRHDFISTLFTYWSVFAGSVD